MKNGKLVSVLFLTVLSMLLLTVLSGCGGGGTPSGYTGGTIATGTLTITSVRTATVSPFSKSFKNLSITTPNIQPGYIISGPADYLKVTLKAIQVETSLGEATIWEGTQPLTLNGSGNLTLSDMTLTNIPTETITAIRLTFNNQAYILGTLSGTLSTIGAATFYTTAAGAYNAATHTGGLLSYNGFQTGPAEEMGVSLSGFTGDDGTMTVSTPANIKLESSSTPTLTILFDISRILRFYDGLNSGAYSSGGGVNPDDPANKAYFFCHSVFPYSVAAFFGAAGQIQGYETLYSTSGGEDVAGWMTVVYNAEGDMISGMLIGDDDNALTIAKGSLDTFGDPFHYNISDVNVTGFQKITTLGQYDDVSWVQNNPSRTGNARFTLRFQSN